MEDERVLKQARAMYASICAFLKKKDWSFTPHDEDLVIETGARGDDLPMKLFIAVKPQAQVVMMWSPLPFDVGEDKRLDVAMAIHVANFGLISGSFDFDLADGYIRYRIASSYRESILSDDVFEYMLSVTFGITDEYNDKFLMVSTGMMSVEQFVEWEATHRDES